MNEDADKASLDVRVGHGYDLHRLEAGRKLVIGGLAFEHDAGCVAHSDGDVVYHALTDALLGALAMDDIGTLFPDDAAEWEGADSRVFVEEAMRRISAAGYRVGNVDVTVILQRPKLKNRRADIRRNIAALLDVGEDRVNVKGKTHEHVDAVGEGRAIECHVAALLLSGAAV